MFKKIICLSMLCIGLLANLGQADSPSDSDIRKAMIQESIQAYPGKCPCPYNRANNGSSCGKRSAWSRAGGYSPLCYESEITDEMIRQFRHARE